MMIHMKRKTMAQDIFLGHPQWKRNNHFQYQGQKGRTQGKNPQGGTQEGESTYRNLNVCID
jgi:hypothetical protein